MIRRLKKTLVWRIYAVGLVQVTVVVVAALMLPHFVTGPHHPHHHHGPPEHDNPRPFHNDRPFPPPMEPPIFDHPEGASRGHDHFHDRSKTLMPLITLAWGLLIVGIGAFWTARWIVRPLERLAKGVKAFGNGNLSSRIDLDRHDELGDLGTNFNEMADHLQTLLLSERELLANISHELRTPLARIRVALDIAAEGNAEASQRSLREIAIDLSELESLIEDILTMKRLQIANESTTTSGFVLRISSVDPKSVSEQAIEKFRQRHPERELQATIQPHLPSISGDALLLRRVLDNLLENAHKYSLDQSTATKFHVYLDGNEVIFEVIDYGMGVTSDDLPHLFKPFFRSDRSRSRISGGVGLGLSLAKRIIEAHRGKIEIQSKQRAGTTVRIAIPAAVETI